jgi:hypothetical protein
MNKTTIYENGKSLNVAIAPNTSEQTAAELIRRFDVVITDPLLGNMLMIPCCNLNYTE